MLEVSEVFEVNGSVCIGSTGQGNRSSTTVIFLSGTHVLPTICLFQWNNLTVRGEGDVSIEPENFGDYGLFTFGNSSNILITDLSFVVSIDGRAPLLFQNSSDVIVSNCMFSLPALSSKGIIIKEPRGTVMIQQCMFRGNALELSNVEAESGSTGLYIFHSEGVSNIIIEDCDFKEFYIGQMARQEDFGNARTIGQALALLFNKFSTGHSVKVSRCQFTENFVESGSTLLIMFDLSSQLNSVLISECQFIGNRNLYGALGIYYWEDAADNSVTIKDSIFTSNIAYLEGGGIFATFLSQNVNNRLMIDNCTFERNRANEGAAIRLFNSPTWFTPAVNIRNDLVSVNISNCVFTNNTAVGTGFLSATLGTEGIINALRIRLFFSQTKYVCVCLCLCVSLCIYIHTYIHTYMCACVYDQY